MSSVAANMSGVKNHALYAGSKAAVEGFCRSFSADAGPKRITVNAIAPGGIKTDMFSNNAWHYSPGATKDTPMAQIEAGIASMCPLGRCAVPDDIAKVVKFLCHPDSEWINGMTSGLGIVDTELIETRSNHQAQRWFHRISESQSSIAMGCALLSGMVSGMGKTTWAIAAGFVMRTSTTIRLQVCNEEIVMRTLSLHGV